MKTILVPTDFSSFADNALNLAILLAKGLQSRILLCHVLENKGTDAKVKKESANKLEALGRKIAHAGDVDYAAEVREGELLPELMAAIKTHKAGLVVMGTKGNRNLMEKILGSCTDQLIQHSHCPVMAVPDTIHFNTPIKRLTYATDYHKSDVKDILQLVELAASLKAQVNVLHVSGDEIAPEKEIKLMEDFMHRINSKTSYSNLSYQMLHGNKVIEKLKEHIQEGSTDIMVTATHHRGLLERIFSKSYTLSLVKDSLVPVIAFHYSAEN